MQNKITKNLGGLNAPVQENEPFAFVQHADGTHTYVTMTNAETMLPVLQKSVGGYVETVPHLTLVRIGNVVRQCVAFCNEEGKIEGLPYNHQATMAWEDAIIAQGLGVISDVLVGDVVFVCGPPSFLKQL